ncbi:MAG: hypothetical protein KC535_01515 [Nanoarchaeota archaeon]|nr:hypothetical protein [Nanoarchaeota archaeon]
MKLFLRLLFLFSYLSFLLFFFLPSSEPVTFSFWSCQEINCSAVLISLLETYPDHACAFYDLRNSEVTSSIREGVIFDENDDGTSALAPVSSKGLMHHKYCVFSDQLVLTGSWNPTPQGTYDNDNYILLINSSKISLAYLKEYEYLQTRTGLVPSVDLTTPSGFVDVFFCPLHDCQREVITALSKATSSVKMLAFTFTDAEIAEELYLLSQKGVDVEVIFEKTRITKYSTIHSFSDTAVKTFLDGNPHTMHEKLIIINNRTVIAGSYNPTKGAAQKNDENLLIITDSSLALSALEEYQRVRTQSTPS